MALVAVAIALLTVGSLMVPRAALAQAGYEYALPGSAREVFSPIREGFTVPLGSQDDWRGLPPVERVEVFVFSPELPTFLRDTSVQAHSRTFFLKRDNPGDEAAEALTTGGWLALETGYLADFFQLRSVVYTSQPLYANSDAGRTLNLSSQGDQITTLGQLNGRFRYAGQQLTVGRQIIRTPFVNPHDIQMIPLTFEGVVLTNEYQGADPSFDYMVSYLDKYKRRDEAGFEAFSNGLGVRQDEGMFILGGSYHKNGFTIGAGNYLVKDTLNTAYGEVDYNPSLGRARPSEADLKTPLDRTNTPSVRFGVNILDQRTVGAELMPGAPYNTYQAAARFVADYRGFVFQGAVSTVGDQAPVLTPFSSPPSYVSMLISNFNQTGVDSYLASLTYDLGTIGLDGLKVQASWAQGWGADSWTSNGGVAEQSELDLTLIYDVPQGPFKGVNVKVEYADWRVVDRGEPLLGETQFRAIVNYTVPLRGASSERFH